MLLACTSRISLIRMSLGIEIECRRSLPAHAETRFFDFEARCYPVMLKPGKRAGQTALSSESLHQNRLL